MITLVIWLIMLFMGLHAFFAGIETGVISINRLRLRHAVKRGIPGAAILAWFAGKNEHLLGTTLLGTNICIVANSVLATSIAVALMGAMGELVATVLMTVLVLLFCEYLPKAWFNARPLDRCLRFVIPLQAAELVLRPFSKTVMWLTHLFVPRSSKMLSSSRQVITREDLKHLAHESARSGVFSSRERYMIQQVIDLSARKAHELMVPLNNMTTVTDNMLLKDYFDIVRQSGFTRIPVREAVTGRFCGIMNVYYVLRSGGYDLQQPVSSYMRKPLFIKEDMPADEILPRLRRFRQPLGLVKNSAGEVVGMVTTEDVLEEIVGELD